MPPQPIGPLFDEDSEWWPRHDEIAFAQQGHGFRYRLVAYAELCPELGSCRQLRPFRVDALVNARFDDVSNLGVVHVPWALRFRARRVDHSAHTSHNEHCAHSLDYRAEPVRESTPTPPDRKAGRAELELRGSRP